MNKSKYSIKAILTTASPLHITEPTSDRIHTDGRLAPADSGFPFARTTRMRINPNPIISSISEEGVAPQLAHRELVIPSNSVTGLLRRRAADLIRDHIASRGEQLSTDACNVLDCGAATGKPDKTNASVKEIVAGANHPYFGVFGGGPRLLRKITRTDFLYAITAQTQHYLDPHFHKGMNPSGPLVDHAWRRRNDDMLYVRDPDSLAKVLPDFINTVNNYQDKIAKDKGNDDSSNSLVRFNAMEFVIPGVHFAMTFDIESGTQAQAGILLASLAELVKQSRIGGHGARGFGRFMLQHLIVEVDGQVVEVAPVWTEKSQPVSSQAQVFFDAWEQAKQGITAAEIEAFAKSLDVAGGAKSKKGKAVVQEEQEA